MQLDEMCGTMTKSLYITQWCGHFMTGNQKFKNSHLDFRDFVLEIASNSFVRCLTHRDTVNISVSPLLWKLSLLDKRVAYYPVAMLNVTDLDLLIVSTFIHLNIFNLPRSSFHK